MAAVHLQDRIAVVQSLSGTGSLRVGAEFISKFLPGTTVYLSNPTWGNHRNIFADAGVEWKYYRWAQVVPERGSSGWAASHAVAAVALGWSPQEVEVPRLSWFWWPAGGCRACCVQTAGTAAAGYHLLSGLHHLQSCGRVPVNRTVGPSWAVSSAWLS